VATVNVLLAPDTEPDTSFTTVVDGLPSTLFAIGDLTKPFAMPLKLLYPEGEGSDQYIQVYKDGKPVYLSDRNPVIKLDSPGVYLVVKTTTISEIGVAVYIADVGEPEE